MKLSNRAISSLLLTAMLATLAACGSEPSAGGNDETTSGKASDTVTETVEKADIPEDKYEGYEFRMLGKETPEASSVNELFAESETGDTLNDAIYQRNRMVEERFDIKMKLITSGSRISDMSQAVLAGDDAADGLVHVVALGLGEEAHVAHVDAEHRGAAVADELCRPQDRAVATEHDRQLDVRDRHVDAQPRDIGQ